LNRNADLEELKRLGASIDKVTDLNHLKPIFFRIEELATQYPQDIELAAGIAAVKARLVHHGQRLINLRNTQQAQSPVPAQPRPVTQQVAAPPPTRNAPPQPTQTPPPAQALPPKPPPPAFNMKRAVIVGAAAGALIFSGIIYTVRYSRTEEKTMTPGSVSMEIRTSPAGASIRIDNQEKCKSNCKLELPPGSYQIQAVLLGYETFTTSITAAQNAQPLDLTLQPILPVVRLFTDLTAGKVVLDDRPPVDLQEGQLVLDRVAPGKHKLKISSPVGETEFEFQANAGAMPEIFTPVKASNMLAVIVSNFTTQAKVFASTNLKISVDGVPSGEVGQQGLELKSLTAGDRELTLGEGKEQQKVLIGLGAQPAVTAFLKLNLNAGTIVVTTGEDDVKVLLNDRATRSLTKRGQLRLPGIPVGNYTIKVVKEGFKEEPPQKVEVKRGEDARVEFKMQAIPKLAGLRLRGVPQGSAIMLDKDVLGAVQADGTFTHSNIQPGEHIVEIRRERFVPKRITRNFKAGETVELTGADVILERATGTIRLNLTPADARVTVKKSDEPQSRALQNPTVTVTDGTYTFTARANGFIEKSVTVQIVGGETKNVDLALTRERVAQQPKPPAAKPGTIADFENASEWYSEGEYSVHKGGNFVLYGRTPVNGTFAFRIALLNGKRLQWFFDYTDSKNYVLFQMDKKHFYRRDVVNGKSQEFKVQHGLDKQNNYQFQIDVSQNTIVHSLFDDGSWRVIDTFKAPNRNLTGGKFGLLIPSRDIFGLSNFRYQPK
jgi:hypothetical protein